jgi:hypothetical protein
VGFAQVAASLPSAGEASLSAGLLVCVAGLGGQGSCSGVVRTGVSWARGGEKYFAKAVECHGLPGRIGKLPVASQGLLEFAGGLPVMALPQLDGTELGLSVGLTLLIADGAVPGLGLLELTGGLLVTPLLQGDEPEPFQHGGLGVPVSHGGEQG